ncbi:MAG: thioredoxin family protein [Myxococcales bacterium]|nr:thioredoxin family protein [Myxococcales bacterium]
MLNQLLLSAAALAAAPGTEGESAWNADWDVAAKAAKEAGKDLLVDFTGSDWCGWCIKLHEEVFAHDEFLKAANEQYVLCALDFPHAEEIVAKVPNMARNQELQAKYAIRGFPTILLMTADGDVFGRTGYAAGGPDAYVKHLGELRATGKAALAEVVELEKAVLAAEGAAKDALLDGAIVRLETLPEDSPFGLKLAAIVRLALAADPENKAGRKLKAVNALLKAGQLDDATTAAARALDPTNEHGLLERVVLAEMSSIDGPDKIPPFTKKIDELDAFGPLKDMSVAFQLYMNGAFFNHRFLKNPEAAKKYAGKVKETGQEIPPQAQQLLDTIMKS